MGYFAVLGKSPTGKALVTRCHLNLWALPGLWPGRKLLYLDVGLELTAESATISEFRLLLPFQVERVGWQGRGEDVVLDLYDSLSSDDTAELVFGGPVKHQDEPGGRSLTIGDYARPLRLRRINAGAVEVESNFRMRADSSLYCVPLDRVINKGESGYVRMRWRVLQPGQLWQRRGHNGGASLDFRICDVRESRFVDLERTLRTQIWDIESVNFFLMATPKLQPVTHSPPFKYLRVLEPGAWSNYLRGAAYLGTSSGLVVYYWKYSAPPAGPSDKPRVISADNPFRVFIVMYKHAIRGGWKRFVEFVLIALFVFALIPAGDDIQQRLVELQQLLGKWWGWLLGVFGLATIVSGPFKLRSWVSNRFLRGRKIIRAIERFLLSLTPR